jgi:hypothetical protein
VLRLIPGISEAEVRGWLEARKAKAFGGEADFRGRGFLKTATQALLGF